MAVPARLRAFYFFYYAGLGVSLPYLAPYLRGLGLSGAEIGGLQMIGPLLYAPVGLAWAALADRLGAPARALRLAAALAVAVQIFLPFAHSVWMLGAVMIGTGLCVPALVPLVDAIAMESLRVGGGTYPRTRLFGSLGYIVLAQGLGLALTARGDASGDILVPFGMLACAAGCALTAQLLPDPPAQPARDARAMVTLLGDRRLRLLMAVSALHWACSAPYNVFYGVFVLEHGLPASVTGMGSAVGVLAEVCVLLVAGALEARYSIRALLGVAFAATALRWGLLSRADSAVAIVGLQLLHGLTFGLFWPTVVRALSRYVPPSFRATGQALFGAVVFGAANALAVELSGWAYDRLGSVAPLYGVCAAVELLPLALVLLVGRSILDPP